MNHSRGCPRYSATLSARRLLSFVADAADTPLAHGGELILRDGAPVGEITSAAYGHSVGGVVALGYVATGGLRVDVTLKDHQLEGVAWLQHLFEKAPDYCRGAVLADDGR